MKDAVWRVSADCPVCGKLLQLRKRRSDGNPFYGCSGYPKCRFTEATEDAMQFLMGEMHSLRKRMAELELDRSASSRSSSEYDVAGALRDLIFQFHPDRNPQGVDATRVVQALNTLRGRVGGRR